MKNRIETKTARQHKELCVRVVVVVTLFPTLDLVYPPVQCSTVLTDIGLTGGGGSLNRNGRVKVQQVLELIFLQKENTTLLHCKALVLLRAQ
jgi:hypothetical protein